MKVGIITINSNYNYGNRLQNYAVSAILKDYGIKSDTIIIKNREDYIGNRKTIKNIVKTFIPIHILVFCVMCKKWLFGDKLDAVREKKFCEFNNRYLSLKTYYINRYEQLYKNAELQEYNFFLTGSDQIWNPYFAGNDLYFLTFIPPEKRIAFIASIGVSELPDEQKERYAALLRQMRYISVREEPAVQLIEELIHKEVDYFFDPVLLLKRDVWEKLISPVKLYIPEKYILCFFLGEEPKEKIDIFANNKGLNVVHMNRKEYKDYYLLEPDHMLYMINNAEYILTDSFHVTAFSIVFQKNFFVFQRRQESLENMFSRMETLLGRLGLINRIQNDSALEDINDISQEQYKNIARMLTEERKHLDETMKKVLWDKS